MATMTTLMITTTTVLLLILTAAAQLTAPSPGPGTAPINLTAILEKGGQFKFFIHLLNVTQAGNQVNIQVNSSTEGMTVFAPTDNAFNNLNAGALNGLTSQQQVQLVLYHISPKYYSLTDFLSVSNPVRTQASGQDGGVFGLNFTGRGNQVNVSTGVVETPINNALRQEFPLGVYVVDKVLLPVELFGSPDEKAPAASKVPAPEGSSDAGDETPEGKAAGPSGKSGSVEKRTGFGLVLGLGMLCVMLLS